MMRLILVVVALTLAGCAASSGLTMSCKGECAIKIEREAASTN